ncbi:MAG: heparinase II/III family protein [Deltaproteobacteria bacterium]|nr:heparinase II/III family protein [Deltaproteobacteria bacterium]
MMRTLLLVLAALLVACPSASTTPDPEPTPEPTPAAPVYPSMMVTPAHKQLILDRLGREPYDAVLADIQATAAEAFEDDDPDQWNPSINGRNAERTQAHAFLAWLLEDETEAQAALDGFARLGDHWDTNDVWDINIRMPHTLMGYVNALDLLRGTPWLPAEADETLGRTLTTITADFFDHFLLNDGVRGLVLGPAQNNHPIRTAAAIGYVALAFPEHPLAPQWANWAFSELDYLWGPDGRYVQADGAVSEGPFYFGFAWGVATAIFIAVDNLGEIPFDLQRDCRNRNDVDPWAPIACTDGEAFTFSNPLGTTAYEATVDWSLGISLPWGSRPPLADAYFNPFNGGALLSSFGGDGRYAWDWLGNRDRPLEMHHGADLAAHHLAYYDDTVTPTEPPEAHRLFPDGGHAVLRSDWGEEALWMLLIGESGPARKTLHDHVDGTSFSLAAFGEYLLVDPGYYKPNSLDNARTAHSPAHNVVLIDGTSAPNKGLLTNWGDADAQIGGFAAHDAGNAVAQATQTYQDSTITRTLVMVGGRFGVVFDHITTTHADPREHRLRLHGYAGFDSGGVFATSPSGARWERPSGVGIDVWVGSIGAGHSIEEPPYAENQAPHVGKFELDRSTAHHGVMDAVLTAQAPDFVTVLAPYPNPDSRLSITESPVAGAVAVRIEDGDEVWDVWFEEGAASITAASWTLTVDNTGPSYSTTGAQ